MDETNTRGGQPENQNAHRGSVIRGAIRRALAEDEAKGRETLQLIVRKMLQDAEQGDSGARRELFDRVDGKPEQGHTVAGTDGGPINHSVTVNFVGD